LIRYSPNRATAVPAPLPPVSPSVSQRNDDEDYGIIDVHQRPRRDSVRLLLFLSVILRELTIFSKATQRHRALIVDRATRAQQIDNEDDRCGGCGVCNCVIIVIIGAFVSIFFAVCVCVNASMLFVHFCDAMFRRRSQISKHTAPQRYGTQTKFFL
jgi:hypothetical protein